jgi:predicted membrane channel-forming protein YqfA (hemolysin III family)
MLHLHEKVRKLAPMPQTPSPGRKLAGIAAIVLLIVVWAALVASLARFVWRWPVLVQAPFYLIMGIAWIIPLKPLVRWSQTGYWRAPDGSGGGGQKR